MDRRTIEKQNTALKSKIKQKSLINKISVKMTKDKKAAKNAMVFEDIRPMKGSLAVSAFATTLGAPRQTMAMASKNVECGAMTITGASRESEGT